MSRKDKSKIYHGVPKSFRDEHTLFYEDYLKTSTLVPMPTGCGGKTIKASSNFQSYVNNLKELTVEFWVKANKVNTTQNSWFNIIELYKDNTTSVKAQIVSDQQSIFILMESFYYYTVRLKDGELAHLRFVIKDYEVYVYKNGKLIYSNVASKFKLSPVSYIRTFNGSNPSAEIYLSDIHISNIDRGNYFPTLPKDYIDGKAIVKARMGQQQIKSDALVSQESSVIIPAYVGDNINAYSINPSDYSGTLIENPEITKVLNASTWASNTSKFTIRALNSEIIGGVIDSDTAITYVTTYPGVGTRTLGVSDVSKLSVGDTICLTYSDHRWISAEKTIESIDVPNKTITWSGAGTQETFSPSGGLVYIIETTSTTSSPMVKTTDGTTVVGTWTGLGTSEATFTLGTNTGLSGKDLVLTYTLNIPKGNSDFPQVPHSIDTIYDEYGNVLNSMDSIVIVDNFDYKVSNDVIGCPHVCKYENTTSSISPKDSFTKELSNYSYDLLKFKDTGAFQVVGDANKTVQTLFIFDVIEMIERKLGSKIPGSDITTKIGWINSHVSKVNFKWTGRAILTDSMEVNPVRYHVYAKDQWKSIANFSYSGTSFVTTEAPLMPTNNQFVQSMLDIVYGGKIYVLVESSNTTSQCRLDNDYVEIELTLNCEPNFEMYYYGTNLKARDGVVCNPILIQKETKTIKRYLPSNECFSTELLNYSYEKNHIESLYGEYIAVQNEKTVASNGTGSFISSEVFGKKMNYANKIPLPKNYKWSDFLNETLKLDANDQQNDSNHTLILPIVRLWGARKYCNLGISNVGLDSCKTISIQSDLESTNMYEFYGALKVVNGEIYLTVLTDKRVPKNASIPANPIVWNYRLPNRPLIK